MVSERVIPVKSAGTDEMVLVITLVPLEIVLLPTAAEFTPFVVPSVEILANVVIDLPLELVFELLLKMLFDLTVESLPELVVPVGGGLPVEVLVNGRVGLAIIVLVEFAIDLLLEMGSVELCDKRPPVKRAVSETLDSNLSPGKNGG